MGDSRADIIVSTSNSITNATEQTPKKKFSDFEFGRHLGEGSYSSVVAAVDKETGKEYAIKMLDKRHIIREKKVKYVNTEKEVFNRVHTNPYMIRLHSTFQDQASLFFVMDIAENGEILSWIKKFGTFSVDTCRFYMAELLCAVEFLHSIRIIHRDLKPENILLDADMHIKLTDFGMSKILDEVNIGEDTDEPRANSFVGTAEYVSPELLTEKAATTVSDIWAIGCICYQMLAGRPPFKASNEYQIFQKITKLEYSYPSYFPPLAEDFCRKILVLDPKQRLGGDGSGVKALMQHPFMDGIDWNKMRLRQVSAAVMSQLIPKEDIMRPVSDAPTILSDDISSPTSQDETQVKDTRWNKFLYEGEHILHTGLVMKKKGFMHLSKKRRLVLTNKPRLMYIDEATMTQKGEVPWSSGLQVEKKSMALFYVYTADRKYNFQDLDNNAQRWCDLISQIKLS